MNRCIEPGGYEAQGTVAGFTSSCHDIRPIAMLSVLPVACGSIRREHRLPIFGWVAPSPQYLASMEPRFPQTGARAVGRGGSTGGQAPTWDTAYRAHRPFSICGDSHLEK